MFDLSVIIAARNEEFLQQTIDNVIANKQGKTEIIVILDGYWPEQGIPMHPDITVIHYEESIGQRAAVNKGAKLSQAKYIMKLDAHCALDRGFDIKLMADCEYDWTVIPRMYNLHAFDWQCGKCGNRTYQGPEPTECSECNNTKQFEKVIVWKHKTNPTSEFYRFDKDLKFAYWRDFKSRPEAQGDIADTMSSLGACFFMHRERFWDIDGLDEKHGSWGQFGTEMGCKSWLSGGRQVTNKKTWFAHMFRTGKGFGFPYKMSGKQVGRARKYSKKLWLENSWPKAKHDLKWLIDKFAPVPEWEDYKFSTSKKLTKGLVYYTDNQCEERIASTVRKQILKSCNGYQLVSVSQYPISFGENIVFPESRSVLTMFKQILRGLEEINTDIVFLVEHDVLYHPSHFEFTPPEKDKYYYNVNTWKLNAKDGQALHYYTQQVSGLCAYRELLLEHYRKRIDRVEKEGFTRKIGFEPGNHPYPRGIDKVGFEDWRSEYPNVDIRHGKNLSGVRFDKKQFRREPTEWQLADEIPFWGKTKGRFDDFLRSLN